MNTKTKKALGNEVMDKWSYKKCKHKYFKLKVIKVLTNSIQRILEKGS